MRISVKGRPIGAVEVAETMHSRAVGLLGRTSLAPGTGVYLSPCLQIHTWFMRFPIDAVFIDGEGQVVRVHDSLAPWRLAWGGLRARAVIELPAGTARQAGLQRGDRLELEAA